MQKRIRYGVMTRMISFGTFNPVFSLNRAASWSWSPLDPGSVTEDPPPPAPLRRGRTRTDDNKAVKMCDISSVCKYYFFIVVLSVINDPSTLI